MKFATKPISHYPIHLRHDAILHLEVKNSNFLQIFSRYGRTCKQIACWVHRWVPVSRDISLTVLWICSLSSWLKTINCLNVFFSGGTARSAADWPPVNCACIPQLFQQLVNTTLCQLFSGNLSVNLFAVYPFKCKLFLSKSCPRRWIPCWLLTSTAVTSQWCDEFPVPQINRKRK